MHLAALEYLHDCFTFSADGNSASLILSSNIYWLTVSNKNTLECILHSYIRILQSVATLKFQNSSQTWLYPLLNTAILIDLVY